MRTFLGQENLFQIIKKAIAMIWKQCVDLKHLKPEAEWKPTGIQPSGTPNLKG